MIPLLNPLLQAFPLEMEVQEDHILGLIQLVPRPNIVRNALLEIPARAVVAQESVDVAVWELQVNLFVHVAVEGSLVAVEEEVGGVQVRLFSQVVHYVQGSD